MWKRRCLKCVSALKLESLRVYFSAVTVFPAISAGSFCCKGSWSSCRCLLLLSLSSIQSLPGISAVKLVSLQMFFLLSLCTLHMPAWSFCCKAGVPVIAGVPAGVSAVTVLLAICTGIFCFSSSTCCRWSPYSVGFHAVLDVLLLQASQVLSFLLLLGSSCFSDSPMLFWHPCVLFWKYLNFLTSVLLFLCRSHRNQEQFYGSCLCYYSGYYIGSENDIYIFRRSMVYTASYSWFTMQ